MRSLVVSEQGAHISVEGEMLVLSLGGNEFRRVSLADITDVVLMGSVEITSGARKFLLSRGVDIVFLTLGGKYIGRATGVISGSAEARLKQYKFVSDLNLCLSVSSHIVRGKILNQRRLLLREQKSLRSEELGDIIADLRLLSDRALSCSNLDELRGIEGAAAAKYWKGFSMCLRNPEFKFEGRNYNPPLDEVNAMLSFGYTFLGIVQEGHILSAGLDPYLGCFHQIEYGRLSLVLDLIEEFRPVCVDAIVLNLLNTSQISRNDFVRGGLNLDGLANQEGGEQGVYLGDVGRRLFLKVFFERLRSKFYTEPRGERRELRNIMKMQVYELINVFMNHKEKYEPFIWI